MTTSFFDKACFILLNNEDLWTKLYQQEVASLTFKHLFQQNENEKKQ